MNKKIVPLTVDNNGDGNDKVEIGTAVVHEIPNGDMIVDLTITNPQVAELLGGTTMKGIMPKTISFNRPEWEDDVR